MAEILEPTKLAGESSSLLEEKAAVLCISRKLGLFLAAGSLAIAGCSVDSYLTDQSNVQCDGKRTIADFEGDVTQVSFVTHDESDNKYNVSVDKLSESLFESSAKIIDAKNTSNLNVMPAKSNGASNPDFTIKTGDAIWVLDVRPDDSEVVISGNC